MQPSFSPWPLTEHAHCEGSFGAIAPPDPNRSDPL
jgi:hypothetical protein